MNSTNRAANRAFLIITGLLLILAGAAGVVLGAVPAITSAWKQQAPGVRSSAPSWVGSPVAGTASILVLALALLALVLIVLLVAFIVRQGRGHTGQVLDRATSPTAVTRIDLAVPQTLLTQHLGEQPQLVGSRVVAYRVHRTPMLKVSVRARRGVSPTEAATVVTRALADLDRILGFELPAFVQISGGFRARVARTARVR